MASGTTATYTQGDQNKLNLIYKKALFNVSNTDVYTNKSAANEPNSSPTLLLAQNVYLQSSQIPIQAAGTVPSAIAGIVTAYTSTSRIICSADLTSTPIGTPGIYPTWKTGITDWIDPGNFGLGYKVKVYYSATTLPDPAASGGTALDSEGSAGVGEWYFDYQSGILSFYNSTLPTGMTSTSIVYVYGYKYSGLKGIFPAQGPNAGKYLTTDGTNVSWATVYSAPTLGSTSIGSGATISTISGLTENNLTLTGSLTAGGGTGTNGQVLQSTGTGVQWATVTSGGGGTTTNALTIGTGLSGTSFNGSSAVTIAIDTNTTVDKTTAQTLTNKTLTLPTIGGTGANFSGSTSGTINLLAAATAGTNTITLPALTGTIALTGQTFYIGTQAIAINATSGTITSLPGVTSLANLATVGTIGTGTWQGTAIGIPYGGNGVTARTKGGIVVGTGTNTTTELAVGTDTYVLTADSTQASGVKWAATGGAGVTSLAGTTNQITVSGSTGSVTISLPSSITISGALNAGSFVPSSSSTPANGMYLPATNTVSFATNSAEQVRIDSSGDIWPITNATVTSSNIRFGDGTTTYSNIQGNYLSSTTGNLVFQTLKAGTLTTALTIDNTSKATFASAPAVTGGTSSGFLKADGSIDTSTYSTVTGGGMTNPMTTAGDIIYGGASGTPTRLAGSTTNNYVLTYNTSTNAPQWAASAGGGTSVTTSTISANTATTIDTVAISGFTTMEYTLSIKQGTKVRSSKVYVQTDGSSNVDYTEYAIMTTGGVINGILVTASISGSNSLLQITITDASTTNATVKFTKATM